MINVFGILSTIIAKIGLSLLTQKIVSEVAVKTLWHLAQKSSNTLDDDIIWSVAVGLNVDIKKEGSCQ